MAQSPIKVKRIFGYFEEKMSVDVEMGILWPLPDVYGVLPSITKTLSVRAVYVQKGFTCRKGLLVLES